MFTPKTKKYQKMLAYAVILSMQLNSLTYAASVVIPDKADGKNPSVSQAANGVQVVDIRLPNGKGLSHNQYTDLQVGKEGVIFNNTSQISQTQLAGYINGNRHLAGDISAKAILNEVTGKVSTSLNGYMEIAGNKADLIIANPNGIVGNNFGYINTGRAVLTTGNPLMGPEGDLRGLNVSQGTITIEGLGLDGKTTAATDIYARAARVNAGIWAQKLNITTGSNEIDYNTGKVAKVTSDADKGVSLDVAALGGMYAGQIRLIGTAKGLGVNMAGNLNCLETEVIVTQAGDIINKGKLGAKDDVNLVTNGRLENSGTIFSDKGTNIAVTKDMTSSGIINCVNDANIKATTGFNNSGTINAHKIDIDTKGTIVNSSTSKIEAETKVKLTAKDSINTAGNISAKEKVDIISGNAVTNGGTVASGEVDVIAKDGSINNSGTVFGQHNVNVDSSKAIANSGTINGNRVITTSRAGSIDNGGKIFGQLSADVHSSKAIINSGDIKSATLEVLAEDGDIDNTGTLSGKEKAYVKSSKAIANAGTINGDSVDVIAARGNIDNSGNIYGKKRLKIDSSKAITNSGIINGVSVNAIAADGNIDNSGTISGQQKANLSSSKGITNSDTGIINGGDLALRAKEGNLVSSGEISAKGNITISGSEAIANNGNIIGSDIDMYAHDGNLNNNGNIQGQNEIKIDSSKALTNIGTINGGSVIAVAKDGNITNNGEISVIENLNITSSEAVINKGNIIGDSVDLTATDGNLDNSGNIHGQRHIKINSSKAITNSKIAAINGGTVDAIAHDGNIDNQGNISGHQNANLNASKAITNAGVINGGTLNVVAQGGKLDNSGEISAKENISISSGEDVANKGNIKGDAIDMAAGNGNLDNSGNIQGHNEIKIDSSKALTNIGTIKGGSVIAVAKDGSITNNGTVSGEQEVKLSSSKAITNSKALSGGSVEVTASDGNIDNRGTVYGQKSAKLNSSKAVINSNTINGGNVEVTASGGNIENTGTIYGETVTNLTGSRDLNNPGLVNGGDTTISVVGNINNTSTGRIYGDNVTFKANTLNNIPVTTAPVIAARHNLNIDVNLLNNKEHALITAEQDMTITAGTINNNSATIETGRNMSITANVLNNTNEHFATAVKLVKEEDIVEFQGEGEINRYRVGDSKYVFDTKNRWRYDHRPQNVDVYIIDDESDYLHTPTGDYEQWLKFTYHRKIHENVITSTDPGKITSGGNMTLIGGQFTNDKSQIIAGGTLNANVSSLNNIEGTGKQRIEDTGHVHSYWRRGRRGKDTTGHDSKTYNPAIVVLDVNVSASAYKSNTRTAGSGIKAANSNINSGTILSAITGTTPGTIFKAAPGVISTTIPGVIPDVAIDGISDKGKFAGNNIPGGLYNRFFTNAPVTAGYYVETDPAYTNKKQWLSSDYFFDSIGCDSDKIAKRLGDGYYEQKLVRDQIMNLTGKRFAGNFSTDTEQYKKLLDNAVDFAKKNQVAVGVEPTAQQLENLKEPIVWMEEKSVVLPNGQIVKALVPRVYLPTKENETELSSAVIGAENIDINTTNDLLNKGTIVAGNKNKLSANNINNYGGTIKGSEVIMKAINDVNNIGGTFTADKSIDVEAGHDINMETTTTHAENAEGSRTSINRVAGTYVTGEHGSLNIKAGNDVNLKAADVSVAGEGKSSILAGNDINLNTIKAGSSNDIVFNKENYRHDRSKKDIGTSIQTDGNLTIQAGRDVNATASYVKTGKNLEVKAGKNINVQAGHDNENVDEHHVHTGKSGGGNKQVHTTDKKLKGDYALGSTFSGNTVDMQAGNDVNITGSNVVGSEDVKIKAGKDVNVVATDENQEDKSFYQLKESGIFSSGFGFTIGTQTTKETNKGQSSMHAGSTIGSIEGNVNIEAGNKAKVEASDIVAGKDINITGKEVDITSADEQYNSQYKYEHKMSGLTISIGGGTIGAIHQNIVQPAERAVQVKDKRLSALHVAKAASDYARNVEGTKDAVEKLKEGKATIGINIGFGSSSSKETSDSTSTIAKGSNVLAGGDVNITATEKDVKIHGSNVSGDKVNIKAAKDVNISASENVNKTDTDNRNSSVGFGVAISPESGVGGYISGSTAQENIKENSITHAQSAVTAQDKLTIKSGKDTNIIGSKVSGDKVETEVGGNLNVESLQEQQKYREKNSSAGLSISGIGLGAPTVSGSAGVGKMKSDHRTVTDQAGIYAGKQGFDIKVKGNTDLKGAVIDSKATADKNKLTTGTLTAKDIENKSEYDTSGIGISFDGAASKDTEGKLGDKGLIPNIPIGSSDKASSTTKSGVAPGKITITDKAKQKQDISELNRDTTNTLNKLEQIFDKDTIQEKQEMAALFGELAYNQIHDIGKRAGWKEGDPNKVALHAIVGGIMAKLGDSNFLAGASGAAVNEMLQKELSKIKDPALHQWASAAVGAAVGGIVGGKSGAQTGASTAAMGTKENALNETENEMRKEKLEAAKTGMEAIGVLNEIKEIDLKDRDKWFEKHKNDLPDFYDDGEPVYIPREVGFDINGNRVFYIPGPNQQSFSITNKLYVPEAMKKEIMDYDISKLKPGEIYSVSGSVSYGHATISLITSITSNGEVYENFTVAGEIGINLDSIFNLKTIGKLGMSIATSNSYIYNKKGEKITNNELIRQTLIGNSVGGGVATFGNGLNIGYSNGYIQRETERAISKSVVTGKVSFGVTEYIGRRENL